MGKKNTTHFTENEGSGKPKAIWTDDLVAILCEICVKEMEKGNRPPGTHFAKIGWVNVVNVFKEITGRDYEKRQVQSKWESLKTDWRLWSSQLHKQTGIGWDPTKKTVDAPPKWWQRKVEMLVEYPKKGKNGTLGGSEHDKQTVDKENEEASQEDQDRGKKRTNDESEINKGVVGGSKGKLGGAAKLSKQIDRLVEVVESRSTTTSEYGSSQGTGIAEMGKKNTTSFTENEGSGKPKAIWSNDLIAILCEICVKEVAKGNRPHGTHFDKIEWVNVVNVFKEITGRDYDPRQLQNKWAKLKINWKLWSSQLHKETGIGWDPAKKMVDAPPKWWQRKIEMNYRKKGKKGKLGGSEHDKHTAGIMAVEASTKSNLVNNFDDDDDDGPVFFKRNNAASRQNQVNPDVRKPSSSTFNGQNSNAQKGKTPVPSSKQIVDREIEEASQDDQHRRKKRTNDESEINKEVVGGSKGKKAKLGGAAKLSKQIDRHVEVVESMSTTTPVYRSSQGTSIPEVMEVVATLPGAEKGSRLWWFATELFCSQDKREMFSVMTDLDLKLQFLIRNHKKFGN